MECAGFRYFVTVASVHQFRVDRRFLLDAAFHRPCCCVSIRMSTDSVSLSVCKIRVRPRRTLVLLNLAGQAMENLRRAQLGAHFVAATLTDCSPRSPLLLPSPHRPPTLTGVDYRRPHRPYPEPSAYTVSRPSAVPASSQYIQNPLFARRCVFDTPASASPVGPESEPFRGLGTLCLVSIGRRQGR